MRVNVLIPNCVKVNVLEEVCQLPSLNTSSTPKYQFLFYIKPPNFPSSRLDISNNKIKKQDDTMQWKYYKPMVILCLILSSVSLVLNISKYKNSTKSREEMLVELGQMKLMASRYLAALDWTNKDLRDRVSRLEKYNRKLIQEIIYLTQDETFLELKPHPVKTIRIQQKQTKLMFGNWFSNLLLEIPAEDANLVFFNSPEPQAMPTPSIITRTNFIRKNQIPWQERFRIDSRVMKIPFTDWAVVFSHGLRKIVFCADALLLLGHVLPDPTSPIDAIIDKSRKEEAISTGEAPDYVEILFNIPNQNGLFRTSEVFLDAMTKIYPDIQRRYPSNRERLSSLPFNRYFQPAGKDKKEQDGGGGDPLLTNMKIELETYKQAIIRLKVKAESHGNNPSPRTSAYAREPHYGCSAPVRLQSIYESGNAFFIVEDSGLR